jgi:hypothetical protein
VYIICFRRDLDLRGWQDNYLLFFITSMEWQLTFKIKPPSQSLVSANARLNNRC